MKRCSICRAFASGPHGASYRLKTTITIEDLAFRTNHVITNEIQTVRNQMARNRVEMLFGRAEFVDPHRLRIHHATGPVEQMPILL